MEQESLLLPEALQMIGHETGPGEPLRVDRSAIRYFAEALLNTNPLFLEEEKAKQSTFGSIVAPLTFPLFNCRTGIERGVEIPLKARRRLRGSDECEFLAPVVEGDVITASTRIVDIYERAGRSGRMAFVVAETTYVNQRGETVLRNKSTVIKR